VPTLMRWMPKLIHITRPSGAMKAIQPSGESV
jgi:hypothetical protein